MDWKSKSHNLKKGGRKLLSTARQGAAPKGESPGSEKQPQAHREKEEETKVSPNLFKRMVTQIESKASPCRPRLTDTNHG